MDRHDEGVVPAPLNPNGPGENGKPVKIDKPDDKTGGKGQCKQSGKGWSQWVPSLPEPQIRTAAHRDNGKEFNDTPKQDENEQADQKQPADKCLECRSGSTAISVT